MVSSIIFHLKGKLEKGLTIQDAEQKYGKDAVGVPSNGIKYMCVEADYKGIKFNAKLNLDMRTNEFPSSTILSNKIIDEIYISYYQPYEVIEIEDDEDDIMD